MDVRERRGGGELGGVEAVETVATVYCMTEESTCNLKIAYPSFLGKLIQYLAALIN